MTAAGPLSGITIVDLTRVLAGPFCTLLLADLGARVIKVEQPGKGDDSRSYGPFINGKSGYFVAQNRGKESIALDLKLPADVDILHRLLRKADVLAENFRPGAAEQLPCRYDLIYSCDTVEHVTQPETFFANV
ncbi:MAG: CoA transferase, partial [Methyloceanibacter sp.]